jgi:hypothetical protein
MEGQLRGGDFAVASVPIGSSCDSRRAGFDALNLSFGIKMLVS